MIPRPIIFLAPRFFVEKTLKTLQNGNITVFLYKDKIE